jgi:acyl transferase domain-containing protein
MYFSAMHAMSPTGRSAAFDASADGYVRSDGCGVVILKRLSAALRDADPIVAVIRGSAINHDGRSNGLTAPNGLAQEAVIRKALERGGVLPEQVSYVEAHGTGTPLGDPIEAQALGAAFAAPGRDALRIGSVKTNIGHTEAAAGIAGLIKVALALEAQRLPASIHYRTPNSNIDWRQLNLSVVTESTAWPRAAAPRFAGVSSFGFSGTNAHAVLEESPARPDGAAASAAFADTPHLIAISAHTPAALDALAGQLASHLGEHPDKSVYDVAFTLGAGRRHLRNRVAFVASTVSELRERLKHHSTPGGCPQGKIAFVFSGQGSQYVGMGRELAARWPIFSATLEQCDLIFSATSGLKRSLRQVMWAETGSEEAALLQHTEYTQAALFSLEYALFRLWSSLGVVPDFVVGHSIGEIVAACAAGVFSMDEALRLCIARGRFIGALAQEGAMAAVAAGDAVVAESIAAFRGDIDIAAVNSPSQTVISGPRSALTAASALLASRGMRVVPLNVSRAFHSSLLNPALEPLRSVAEGLRYRNPTLAMVSTVTGARAGAELANAGFWVDQVRKPVLFRQAAEVMAREGVQACFELGPDAVLLPHIASVATQTRLSLHPSLRRGHGEVATFLEAVAGCYRMGGDLNWRALWPARGAYVSLPTYPWQRNSYWPISEAQLQTTNPASPRPSQASEAPATPQPHAAVGGTREAIVSRLREFLAMQLRVPSAAVSSQIPFVEMGADSIVFLEAAHMIEKAFGLTLATHQLFGELNTLDALATFIEQNPVARTPVRAAATVYPSPRQEEAPVEAAGLPAHNSALKAVIDEQLRLMSRQLDLLASQAAPLPARIEAAKSSPEPRITGLNGGEAGTSDRAVAIVSTTETTHVARQLSQQQKTHIDSFAASYVARTRGSRQHALSSHRVLADRRIVAGFTFETKELQYPIVGASAAGSRLQDVDGNDYIDVSMGFGVHLFGHQPEFIRRALERQLAQGFQIGPQAQLAGKVAQAIVDCTHLDRVTFCNSGTEAVMTALRLARATTGRSKVLLFKGSYHGHFDGTLALARHDTQGRAIPMAPGVTQGAVEDVIFGDYGDTTALESIDKLGAELAAVLVEPVQSRHPELQPRAFLHELRALTRRHGIALIFDEVITGFRLARGGAQEFFGVEADLATYGKLLGGGMPIGVVAGREQYIDRIDGGRWTYGDHSAPSVPTTFFAGTFSKHPLTMAASLEVLEQLTRRGAALYTRLDGLTAQLANRLNTFFEQDAVPLRVAHCGSIFRIAPAGALSSVSYLHEPLDLSLFYHHMIHRGVYFWEGRTGFLSDAHTEADIAAVADAVESSVAALRAGGFLFATPRTAASLAVGEPARRRRAPLSWGQEGLWFFSQLNGENGAYNMHGGVRLTGMLRIDAVEASLVEIFRRHDVLRTTFLTTADGTEQIVALAADVKLDLARRRVETSGSDSQRELRLIVEQEARRPFDLANGPLLRFVLVEFSPRDWVLLVTMHHIVGDGWSLGLLVREFSQVYQAQVTGRRSPLGPLRVQYADYAAQERGRLRGETLDSLLQYWKEQLEGAPTLLSLPTDRPRSEQPNYQSATYSSAIGPDIVERLRSLGRTFGTTLYMTLLSTFGLLLHRLTAQTDLLVGSIVANRPRAELRDVIGLFVNRTATAQR